MALRIALPLALLCFAAPALADDCSEQYDDCVEDCRISLSLDKTRVKLNRCLATCTEKKGDCAGFNKVERDRQLRHGDAPPELVSHHKPAPGDEPPAVKQGGTEAPELVSHRKPSAEDEPPPVKQGGTDAPDLVSHRRAPSSDDEPPGAGAEKKPGKKASDDAPPPPRKGAAPDQPPSEEKPVVSPPSDDSGGE